MFEKFQSPLYGGQFQAKCSRGTGISVRFMECPLYRDVRFTEISARTLLENSEGIHEFISSAEENYNLVDEPVLTCDDIEHLADKILDCKMHMKYVLSRFIHRLNENKMLIQRHTVYSFDFRPIIYRVSYMRLLFKGGLYFYF